MNETAFTVSGYPPTKNTQEHRVSLSSPRLSTD